MITRTFDILEQYRTLYKLEKALSAKHGGSWYSLSGDEYIRLSDAFACGLIAKGFTSGDKIAIISPGRPEWNVADMGMAQLGIISVPVNVSHSAELYTYIFTHAAPRMVIVSDKITYNRLKPVLSSVPAIEQIYSFNNIPGVDNWMDIVALGEQSDATTRAQLIECRNQVEPAQVATLLYTSGTTGKPKGVMLSHGNLVSNILATAEMSSIGYGHKTLSVLPISHVYERMMNYVFQYKGLSIYYAANMGAILENLIEVQPDIINTVPRLMERVTMDYINKARELSTIKRAVLLWAIRAGVRRNPQKKQWRLMGWKAKMVKRILSRSLEQVVGKRLKAIVAGGTDLHPNITRLFMSAGIDVLSGYGLTETSPVIAVSNQRKRFIKPGTVGKPLPGIELRFCDDGEILIKGPNVMLGYYKDPERTAQVLDAEGFFHTGDVGYLDQEGYLVVTDRKKDIFYLAHGRKIAPQVIENRVRESFFIDQLMILGEGRPFVSALISPNFSYLHNWCYLHKISFFDNTDMISNPLVVERFREEILKYNTYIDPAERIQRFKIVTEEWSPQTGELSSTLRLRRPFILEKYQDLVRSIYDLSLSGED